jgi:hypothetical protein
MAWLSATSAINERKVVSWLYQFDTVDEDWLARFGDEYSFDLGDEVARRIAKRITTKRYSGVTQDAADNAQVNVLADNSFSASQAAWNGAGGYDVTVDKIEYASAGWSEWKKIEDWGGSFSG